MAEHGAIDQKTKNVQDTSLKRYFKYMLINRKMSVQFTSRKIREIIEEDLEIKLESHQSLYSKVCTEAFAYYMQSWPEWNMAIKSSYSDSLYDCLKKYLRSKLLYLKIREVSFTRQNKEKCNVPPPDNLNCYQLSRGDKSLYTLDIHIPEKEFNSTDFKFTSDESNSLVLELDYKTVNLKQDFNFPDILQHPFVSLEFKIPGLIHFERSTPFKIDHYIHNCQVTPPATSDFIISVEMGSSKLVYTYDLMLSFFKELNSVIFKYKSQISETQRLEISSVCNLFLSAIADTNLCNKTVCESATVNYNIGKGTYCVDNLVEVNKEDLSKNLTHRMMLTPIVSFSLLFFRVLQNDVTLSGFKYFNFSKENDKVFESVFMQYINQSVKYKCILCNSYYNLYGLKTHLNKSHPLDPILQCTKCFKMDSTSILLQSKWHHDCVALN